MDSTGPQNRNVFVAPLRAATCDSMSATRVEGEKANGDNANNKFLTRTTSSSRLPAGDPRRPKSDLRSCGAGAVLRGVQTEPNQTSTSERTTEVNLTNRRSILAAQQLAKQIAFESDVEHGVYQGQPLTKRAIEKSLKAPAKKLTLQPRVGT